jgi:hypothetical protein
MYILLFPKRKKNNDQPEKGYRVRTPKKETIKIKLNLNNTYDISFGNELISRTSTK